MSKTKWTPEQEAAINSLNKSLIVSAAAGSGKTSVLVQRIVNMLCNNEKPVSVDRLLIVTFTRAAANEMRQRLSDALEKKISEEPDNKYLLRQQSMLAIADICTMDQFFNSLVKENFQQLGIMPDFRIIDTSESKALEAQALEEVLDEAYVNENTAFKELLSVLGCDKDDNTLVDCIKRLNNYANAYPQPEEWLEGISKSYIQCDRPQDTVFGEIILDKVANYSRYALKQLDYAIGLTEGYDGLEKIFELLNEDREQARYINELALGCEWDKLYNALKALSFSKLPSVNKEVKDSFEKKYAQSLRNSAKETLSSLCESVCISEEDFKHDVEVFRRVVPELIGTVISFRRRYFDKKLEINALEFDDISHFALSLLVKDGKLTDIAYELRDKYDEILIDEYQDTNSTQDSIFSALSKDEKNLFIVGDIKQSIYGFRLAMPEIFIRRIDEWKSSTDENKKYISLDKNFRSRKEVLDGANYLFGKIMNSRTGNVVYDEAESLKAGAEYPETVEPKVEMYLLDKSKIGMDKTAEVIFVADKIEELLKTASIYDGKNGVTRKAQPKDICVLLRKNALGPSVLRELKTRGLSAYFEDNSGFFKNTEVTVILSMLAIIDNPLQDVPLLSVLMSTMFGFSADDISRVRVNARKEKLYRAVRSSEDEKCKNFIKELEEYKKLSSVLSVRELIRTIYEKTGYLSVISAMNNGEIRRLNLMLLLDYAGDYEQFGKNGLPGFMRYIESMKKNDSDFKPSVSASEGADVIRIMTVHKSKGLEFPIVILADTGSRVNSSTGSLVVNQQTGIGLKICEKSSFKKYSTIQYEATKYKQALDECSEELRALYVALTRAKERLIITGMTDDASKLLTSVSAECFDDIIDPVAVENKRGFLKQVLMGFFRHSDAGKLRAYAGYSGECDKKSPFELTVDVITQMNSEIDDICEVKIPKQPSDEMLVNEIKHRVEYEYEYFPLSDYTTKMAASAFNRIDNGTEYFISEKPSFAKKNGLTAAEKGTAMHKFMEVCDFSLAKADASAEAKRLVNEGKLTREQADSLNTKLIAKFFESDIYKRIEKSPKVMREQKFTVFVPLSLLNADKSIADNEKILVQGVIDCAFYEDGELVVLDYKTDRVSSADELEERYSRQLEVYKIAAQQVFSVSVKELLLYSFSLGDEKIIEN